MCVVFSMPTVIEEVPEVIKVAADVIPALKNVPILGRIISITNAGKMDDTKAMEQLQSQSDKAKKTRTQLKDRYNSKVIKIKDALQCVEDNVMDGKILLSLAKGLMHTITGSPSNAADIMFQQIADCMVKKALGQKNRRVMGKFVTSKNLEQDYSEIEVIRRGKLHPFLSQIEGRKKGGK